MTTTAPQTDEQWDRSTNWFPRPSHHRATEPPSRDDGDAGRRRARAAFAPALRWLIPARAPQPGRQPQYGNDQNFAARQPDSQREREKERASRRRADRALIELMPRLGRLWLAELVQGGSGLSSPDVWYCNASIIHPHINPPSRRYSPDHSENAAVPEHFVWIVWLLFCRRQPIKPWRLPAAQDTKTKP